MQESVASNFVGSSRGSGTLEDSTPKSEFLLLKITPEQVSRYWDELGPKIMESLDPEIEETVELRALILQAILRNEMQAWMLYRRENGKSRRLALTTTRIYEDYLLESRNCYITSLYAYERIEMEGWKSALETLKTYARGAKCSRVIANTQSARVLELTKQLGGSMAYTFVRWEV